MGADRFDIVPLPIIGKGKMELIYVPMYINEYTYTSGLNGKVIDFDYLNKKSSIAGRIGMKTITLTTYLKNNCNYDISVEPRSHYIFRDYEDAKKAVAYLNDCLVVKKMIGG